MATGRLGGCSGTGRVKRHRVREEESAKEQAMIACVCIVAKENNPLLLKVFPQAQSAAEEDETKFHHICYCSIDAFEEKEQAMR